VLIALTALGALGTVRYQLQVRAAPTAASEGTCPATGCTAAKSEQGYAKAASDADLWHFPAEPHGRHTSKFVRHARASLDGEPAAGSTAAPPHEGGARAAAQPAAGSRLNVFANCHSSERTDAEMRDQLACLGGLAVSDVAMTPAEVHMLSERTRELLGQLAASPEAPLAEAAFALAAGGALQRRCAHLKGDLSALRQAPRNSMGAIAALRTLRGLQADFVAADVATERGSNALAGTDGGPERLSELRSAGDAASVSLLEAVREARTLVAALPRKDARVAEAASRDPAMLQAVEDFALGRLAGATDAAATFSLGLYWSDVGQGGSDAPLLGLRRVDASWAKDSQGSHVPADLARAEQLLAQGQELSDGPERDERAASRALRLYQHAKLLAVAHHDAAAEARYLSSARVAASHRRQRLAGHALTRLAYFYLLRGRHQEAEAQASEALTHATDPLAQYIQATQRRGLGLLRTEEDAKFAEEQLAEIAGKLPSKALEEKRQAAWEELNSWRQAAEGGITACLGMADAAQVLICGLCKMAFGVFPLALTEDSNNLLGVAGQD